MKNYLTTNERNKIQTVIDAALERFDEETLMHIFLDRLDWKQKSNILKTIIADDEMKEELKEELINSAPNTIVIKIDTMDKRDKIIDFLSTDIYPYYNEQQMYLFN